MRNDSLFSNGLGFLGKIGFEDLLQKKQTKKKTVFPAFLAFFPLNERLDQRRSLDEHEGSATRIGLHLQVKVRCTGLS